MKEWYSHYFYLVCIVYVLSVGHSCALVVQNIFPLLCSAILNKRSIYAAPDYTYNEFGTGIATERIHAIRHSVKYYCGKTRAELRVIYRISSSVQQKAIL